LVHNITSLGFSRKGEDIQRVSRDSKKTRFTRRPIRTCFA